MMNKAFLMGRLIADPELKQTPNGTAVCSFRIAVDRDFKNKETGERDVDFFSIVTWRGTAEFAAKNFTKGRMVVVCGPLQVRNWTDKEGNKRSTTKIIAENVYFADSRAAGQSTVPETMTNQQDFQELGDDDAVELPF